jgi:hypothetical protein
VNQKLASASGAATEMAARLRAVALDLEGALPPEVEPVSEEAAVVFDEGLAESAD